jgi:hypothetical protein
MAIIERFKAETFQPLATIVIPGTVAIGPFILIAVARSSALNSFMEHHEVSFGTLVIFAAVATGLILEDLGAGLEGLWDKIQSDSENNKGIWFEYLRTAFVHEPVGHRYLRSIVLRMKFGLSFGISLVPMFIGLVWLNSIIPFAFWGVLGKIGAVVLVAVIYVLHESYQSSVLLSELRQEILKSVRVGGIEGERASN